MERMAREWYVEAGDHTLEAAVLGVTPEIVNMGWPEQTLVTAFDKEPAMIGYLWPKAVNPHAKAVCCNWRSLPVADACLGVVAGDGSLTQLSFSGEHQDVARELTRVIMPGGILVLRLFVPPLEPESVEHVFEDLWSGQIENFNAFRWRLLMSLQESPEKGVCVGRPGRNGMPGFLHLSRSLHSLGGPLKPSGSLTATVLHRPCTHSHLLKPSGLSLNRTSH
jgi:SAM-dependent methyltransferase